MLILSLLWILYTPYLVLCGFAGGIYLIISGVKYHKLLVSIMGLLSVSFVVLPYIFGGWALRVVNILTSQPSYIGFYFL